MLLPVSLSGPFWGVEAPLLIPATVSQNPGSMAPSSPSSSMPGAPDAPAPTGIAALTDTLFPASLFTTAPGLATIAIGLFLGYKLFLAPIK